VSIDEELQENQRKYDEDIVASNARIQTLLDKLDRLREPVTRIDVMAPARLLPERGWGKKLGPLQPDYVHIGAIMQLRYTFPISKTGLFTHLEVKWFGQKRVKRLNADASVISGDTIQVVYSLTPTKPGDVPDYMMRDTATLI
jgi:hypothetical protein